ncbi:MAG: cytochrome P450 [Pseudomonadota bacterium]
MDAAANELIQMEAQAPGEDDHAYFRRYREAAPVARSAVGVPVVLRHEHIARMIDPATTRQLETEALLMFGVTSGPIWDLYQTSMLFSNGEAHARRRGPVAKTFAFKLIEEVRGEVRAMAERIVEQAIGQQPFDFLNDFAGDIPARVIAGILGVAAEDAQKFRGLVYQGVRAVGVHEEEERPAIEAAIDALRAYVGGLIGARKAAPKDDFLSDYNDAAAARGDLSEDEVRAQVLTLIAAGSDTTRLAICSSLNQLLAHPAQWRAFCEDPEGLKRQVAEEGLRFDPSVASFPRVATADIEIDGYILPAGGFVGISTMSAMRDAAVYRDADAFDIFREDHPKWHPVFGAGAHRCLGEALAKIELEETLAAIATLAPRTRLSGDAPVIKGLRGVRQIDRMDVVFG